MSNFKRCLCLFLALLLFLNIPGTIPRANAVALVDDAAVITAGLLMASLAGITFSQSNHAVSSVQNFLSVNEPALSAATKLATSIVSDTGKLLITKDFQSSFNDFLPALLQYFVCVNGTNAGSISGSAPIGVPVNLPIYESTPAISDVSSPRLAGPNISFTFDITDSSGATTQYLVDNISRAYWFTLTDLSNNRELNQSRIDWYSLEVLWAVPYIFDRYLHVICSWHYTSGTNQNTIYTRDYHIYDFPDVASAKVTYSSENSIPFTKSDTIDGSQAQNILSTAELPDTSYGDDREKYLDIGAVSGVVSGGLAGSTVSPGISPDEITAAIQQAVIAIPLPTTPTEATEATESTEPEDNPLVPYDPVTPGLLSGLFSDLDSTLDTLFSGIKEAVLAIPGLIQTVIGIISQGFSDVLSALESLLSGIKEAVLAIPGLIQTVIDTVTKGFADVKTWLESLIESLTGYLKAILDAIIEFFTVTFPAWIADVKAWALALPQTLVDAISLALAKAFIPSAGYWDAKIAACMAAFPFFDSIVNTGRSFGSFFSGLGSKPPIIYIDLQNSNSFALGGREIFMDLSWYSQYKPTVDTVLSAFLWLIVLWRLFLALPGILRGAAGLSGKIDREPEHFHHEED